MFSKRNLTGHLFWCLLKPKLVYAFEQKLQILSLFAFGLHTVAVYVDVGFETNGNGSASFPESEWVSSKVKAEAGAVKVETVAVDSVSVDSSSSELELSTSD